MEFGLKAVRTEIGVMSAISWFCSTHAMRSPISIYFVQKRNTTSGNGNCLLSTSACVCACVCVYRQDGYIKNLWISFLWYFPHGLRKNRFDFGGDQNPLIFRIHCKQSRSITTVQRWMCIAQCTQKADQKNRVWCECSDVMPTVHTLIVHLLSYRHSALLVLYTACVLPANLCLNLTG